MTLKNKDYSREKEIIGEYSRKVKNAASDCKYKFKESIINGKNNQDENVDDSQDLTKETVSEDSN